LREAGLLAVREEEHREYLDLAASRAFALVDHQFAQIYLAQDDPRLAEEVAALFRGQPGIAQVLVGSQQSLYHLDHPRSGEVVLVSEPNSWQAYYWWYGEDRAPKFAWKVDIHSKPGYDPVELFYDRETRGIPLDATLVKGSHGAPAESVEQKTVLIASNPYMIPAPSLHDTDVFHIVLHHFGIDMGGGMRGER
jgi:hypothetical protein